jgi:uncharacterized membrane protein YqhA
MRRSVEELAEAALWSTRYVVVVAVVASVVASFAAFFLATADTVLLVADVSRFVDPSIGEEGRRDIHAATLKHVVKIVDFYLLGSALLIFGLGLYELFISRIDRAQTSESRAGVLVIRSFDDLKNRLGKVILMIMVVSFFERVLAVRATSALEVVYVAVGIAVVAGALWLSHADRAH